MEDKENPSQVTNGDFHSIKPGKHNHGVCLKLAGENKDTPSVLKSCSDTKGMPNRLGSNILIYARKSDYMDDILSALLETIHYIAAKNNQ